MSFTKDEYIKIGKAIKRELEDRGMSQKQLGEEAGLSKKTISMIIHGTDNAEPSTLCLINKVLLKHPKMLIARSRK